MKALIILFVTTILLIEISSAQETNQLNKPEQLFIDLLTTDSQIKSDQLIDQIRDGWQPVFAVMLVETITLVRDRQVISELATILNENTDLKNSYDLNEWYDWLWKNDEKLSSSYSDFKGELYGFIDPKFTTYFTNRQDQRNIRLDEVRWGGVVQDGIPPLRNPKMIAASDATYLEDDNLIFGIAVNGDVRAYPKRILAWHEMFVDEVGGIPVAGVYCTLCGTVILYKTVHDGTNYELGTSGFLYRSNKLMYDQETQSLWNTLKGEPSIGPLVGKGIQLEHLSVVTTTWGEWRRRHPDTQVLSLDTGYKRDYGEGVAYNSYFSTDELMFTVPKLDKRLKNKDEVLAIRLNEVPDEQLAISTKYLSKNTVFQDELNGVKFVVFTDQSGGNRVYESKNIEFNSYDGDKTITDKDENKWTLYEDKIVRADGFELKKLPFHRAFWFGWKAAFPETRLIK